MLRRPAFRIHICEYTDREHPSQLPSRLFDHPPTARAAADPELPLVENGTDARFGLIEVHFLRPRTPQHKMYQHGNVSYGRFQEVDSFAVEPAQDAGGNAPAQQEVRVAFGIVHLFRSLADDTSEALAQGTENTQLKDTDDDSIGTVLCMLSVPSSLTVSSLLDFVEPALEAVEHMRILRSTKQESNMVLLKFRDTLDAEEFYKMYNGRPFQALDPSKTCSLVYVTGVTAAPCSSTPHVYPLLSRSEPWPVITHEALEQDSSLHALRPSETPPQLRAAAYELPTCPVCLDRLDASISGLITGVCQHAFHCTCLQRCVDSRCPVCRYTQTQSDAENEPLSSASSSAQSTRCQQCGTSSNLWVCLICAHVGCGRYKEGHARQHYAETGHLYSLELETQRVWDYAGDGYVHRLIQSKSDGKLVELPSASGLAAAMPDRLWNARCPGSAQARGAIHDPHGMPGAPGSTSSSDIELLEEKMHALGLEYSNMIMSQLDSQRMYYEGLLSVARSERIPREECERVCEEYDVLRQKHQESSALCIKLQDEVRQYREQVARHESQLRRALESARTLKKERDEEKSVSDGLYKHVLKLQEEQKALHARVAELSDELRDMMFFVSARDKISEADKVLPAEDTLHGGTAYLPEPRLESSKPKSQGRRR